MLASIDETTRLARCTLGVAVAIIQTVFGPTASYLNASQGVYVDLPSWSAWDGQHLESIYGVQAVLGSAFNDVIQGSPGNFVLDGGPAGADTLYGAAGNILSYVTSSTPVIIDLTAGVSWDGQNNDQISNFHNVIGSSFNDTIYGTSGDDIINGGVGGEDTLYGSGGTDTVSYSLSLSGVIIDLNSSLTWDGTNNDHIYGFQNAIGSSYDDTFIGAPGVTNHFDGGAGSDTIMFANVGKSGNKFDSGGVSVDLHDPQHETSFYHVGFLFDAPSDLDTFANIENAVGSTADDYFISGPDSNTFWGNNASMLAGPQPSPQVYTGRYWGDYISYAYSSTPVIVDLAASTSWDGRVNDHLYGISNVIGSQYGDTLYSTNYNNYFDGGHGADTYVFSPGFSYDTIESLTDGGDHIRLTGFGNISFNDLSITAAPGSGSEVHVSGDPNANDVIHIRDLQPSAVTADYFIFN